MYISIVISAIILTLLISALLILHWAASVLPFAAQAIATVEMIILLSILILVHEAGHFFVAELFKMKVTKFAFGLPIGPTLWRKKFGDVEILIHAFLFGRYVAFPDDDKELNLPEDSPDRFLNRPAYQRFWVLSAGVIANLICAFLFVAVTAGIWGKMPSGKYEVFVKSITAEKTESIWNSGMQAGDKIIEINGTSVTNPKALVMYAQLSKKFDGKVDNASFEENYGNLKKINPAFARDEIIPADVIIKLPKRVPEQPFVLNEDIIIGLEAYKDKRTDLSDSQKAIRDSLNEKNILVSDGTYSLADIAYAITDNSCPLNITVERNGETIELEAIYPNEQGLIGIMMDIKEVPVITKGVPSIISASTKYLWTQTKLFCYSWYQLFTGKLPMSSLHGIIAVAKVGGDIIHSSGLFSGLLLTAVISLYLAIFNFLPIPALDGGHVLFLIIEKIRGKKVDEETADKIMTVFFIFLILLIIVVCANDIYALVMNKI